MSIKNYSPEKPKLDMEDAEIHLNITSLNQEKEACLEIVREAVVLRDSAKEEFNFHLEISSNAYALGDKKTWLLHKKRWTSIKEKYFKPLLDAKDELAGVVEKINPYEEEILRREGKFFVFHGDELGNARKTTSFPPQSREWHAQRAQGVGGSDVAVILGLSPWNSREDLFLLKTGQTKDKPTTAGSGALWRGNIWEDAIARNYQKLHESEEVFVNCKDSWVSKEREYQSANVDGLIYLPGDEFPTRILEIKTSSTPDAWKEGTPPIYYRLQALWYMDTFGIPKAKFAVSLDDIEYKEFEVVPEEGELEKIHEQVSKFVNEVKSYKASH